MIVFGLYDSVQRKTQPFYHLLCPLFFRTDVSADLIYSDQDRHVPFVLEKRPR